MTDALGREVNLEILQVIYGVFRTAWTGLLSRKVRAYALCLGRMFVGG